MAEANSKKYSKGPNQNGGFKEFLYNPSTGAVMGRTGSSWAKIIIFYLIFFAGLAAFFCLNFSIFYLTLSTDFPKYQMDESLIGSNPGLGFRPMPDPDKSADSTLIWFRRKDAKDYQFWSKQLEKFVDEIDTAASPTGGSVNLQSCTLANGKKANTHSACKVDVQHFQACQKNNDFGYRLAEPCILIKLNKIYGWEPKPYGYDENDRFSMNQLEEDLENEVKNKNMPEELKSYIRNQSLRYTDETQRRTILSTVWINCDGENVADIENVGAIEYYPMRGIASYYFPYMKQQGYQSPFIFVQLKNPLPGVVINVECKAFAKNVTPDRMSRLATTHFEILID